MLVSAIYLHESALGICLDIPQGEVAPLSFEPPSHISPCPTSPDYHRAGHSSSLGHTVNSCWLSNFTRGNVYVSTPLSQFIVPPSPSPGVSTSPFSASTSLFLPCKQVRQYHFSRFHIYVLICIHFSLSGLPHSILLLLPERY